MSSIESLSLADASLQLQGLMQGNTVIGVLDIDSPLVDRFSVNDV